MEYEFSDTPHAEASYLVLIFRGARTSSDELIKMATGKEVHVDVGVYRNSCEDEDGNYHVYSAYVGRNLAKTNINENYYSAENDIDRAYVIPVSENTANNITARLEKLVAKPTPYNSKDLVFFAIPEQLAEMFPDVTIETAHTVFCSQLAVLVIHSIQDPHGAMRAACQALSTHSSRVISPARLFNIIKGSLTQIKISPFLRGFIEPVHV